MAEYYEDITKTVGNTPLVHLNRITEGADATVLAKIESFNPLSSVKDRIGVAMIEDAERRGVLQKRLCDYRADERKYRYLRWRLSRGKRISTDTDDA